MNGVTGGVSLIPSLQIHSTMAVTQRSGIRSGQNHGHITTVRELKTTPSYKKGVVSLSISYYRSMPASSSPSPAIAIDGWLL
jgi:hypothetical protein